MRANPCPICGQKPNFNYETGGKVKLYSVECNRCGIAICSTVSMDDAVEYWNRKTWERLKYYEDLEEQGRLIALPKEGERLKAAYQKQGDKLIEYVPVVRCEDCKYYRNGELFTDIKFCFRLRGVEGKPIGYNFSNDDFCSYGERKENETD